MNYKLIKKYPRCGLNEGDVVTFNEQSKLYEGYGHLIDRHFVEDYSEFWAPVGQENKYKTPYNNPANIGTHHWFNTLLGNAKSRAEYMIEHGLDERTKDYPQDIFDVLTDFRTAKEEGLIKLR